ncbi:hypothetical protein SAMN02745244_03587 [Tessaracoccus bendigoensis DSM 12906]|uniref:Zincin peptidase n=1 Tax=Tessaracoccus bendigoensis DSM 12906 TaxID=1123357 RepID=A0A1M6N9G3_9ACTN|nr:hypothetical protein [Tessaracoccus bendigoensis]SHJ92313.1 hypothetical protein SAMN02745244_03587 [Tessaracoccus bendigoensis DSM 12906]
MRRNPAADALPCLLRVVALSVSPLLIVVGGFWALAAVLEHDGWLYRLTCDVGAFLIGGVAASYLLHELAHLGGLALCGGVRRIRVENSRWRLSLTPEGEMGARSALLVALVGPGTYLLFGGLLYMVAPGSWITWCYLSHVVFLVPAFGDGRTVIVSTRALITRSHPG